MPQDVAVEYKSADVRSAEVHECRYLRIRYRWSATVRGNASWRVWRIGSASVRVHTGRITSAERDLNHVQELAVNRRLGGSAVGHKVVLRQHLEVNLVLVQFVVFAGVVLDQPFLHRSLNGGDRRRVVAVKRRVQRIRLNGALSSSRSHAPGGVDEECASIFDLLEEHRARDRGGHVHDSAEALLVGVQRGELCDSIIRKRLIGIRIAHNHHIQQWTGGEIIAQRPGVDELGHQLGYMHRGWGRIDDEFHARRRRNPVVGHGNKAARLGTVLRVHWDRIDAYQLKGLRYSVKPYLQIKRGVRSAVADSPELFLASFHVDHRWRVTHGWRVRSRVDHGAVDGDLIHGKVKLGNSFGATRALRKAELLERLVPQHDDAMAQPGYCRLHVVDAVHHQGSGCSTLNCGFRQTVDMGVIPVESGRLVGWELQAVGECVSGIHQGFDHVVPMAQR